MHTPRLLGLMVLLAAGAQACGDQPRAPRHGAATIPPRTPGALRIVSWNVLNLFDHHDDPLLSGR